MTSPRLDALRAMVERNPANMQARFGLANEAVKVGALEEALGHYRAYLDGFEDEGNGYARLADVLEQLGRPDEAREILLKGIPVARRHGHPSLADELEARVESL